MNDKSMPLVSVVVPCYNHENFVQECIQSIINQDYKNIELIIIDDGSKDQSVQKIEEMIEACEKRFSRFEFRHRPNKGLCATLNEALEWCEGEYFSPSASDDILVVQKISAQVAEFRNNNIVAVFTGIFLIDQDKNILTTKGNRKKFTFKDVFLRTQLMPGQAVMLVAKEIKKIGGYDESIKIEDLDLFLRLGKQGLWFLSIATPLVYYRKHGNNLSSNHQVMLEAVEKILEKYKDNSLYNQALSRSIMIEAHGIQVTDKKLSWAYMKKALHIYPINILSQSFIRYIIKAIVR